jgi:hypothetical protein
LRKFGKYFDTSNWRAGDLVLTREINPGRIGRWIERAQVKGGYAKEDARWTHAALYLGDRLTVCEATFSLWPPSHGIVQTALWDYCGDSAIRIRRPLAIDSAEAAWLLAIMALTQMRKDYDFGYVLRLASIAFSGKGFWTAGTRSVLSPSALICSTLYADAFARQTGRTLGEQNNGICTPAFLSQSDKFEDKNIGWLPILA